MSSPAQIHLEIREESRVAEGFVAPGSQASGKGKVYEWLDERAGVGSLLRAALDEPIPGGASLAYVFGSGLLFLIVSQIITGICLMLYYVPSADHAHTTVAYITKEVTSGSFLRSIHSYGSSAIVIVLLLHITQTFLYGSYKGRRELLWLAGCVLFALMLGMSFTGYLLPWDQKAYFATTVGTNILSEVPVVGPTIKALLRGGTQMGTLTLSRFFVLHVIVIPALIAVFVVAHIYLFRKAGSAGPITGEAEKLRKKTEMFYPKQLLLDGIFLLLIIAGLALMAHFFPAELGPKANPADTQYVPRPEWYYIPVFQWLKYWNGALALIGILVIPGIVAFLFAGLPFLDRSPERRPWKRPVSVSVYMSIFIGLGSLGAISHRNDLREKEVAVQLQKQHADVEKFMKQPFEPEMAGLAPVVAIAAPADPLAAKGKELFSQQGCTDCHGENGVGTDAGPKLVGVGAKFNSNKLMGFLKEPTQAMTDGGMTAPEIGDADLKALIAYLEFLK
jgi:ubiquinol-cytochrome c reductase cytochrome b subunit